MKRMFPSPLPMVLPLMRFLFLFILTFAMLFSFSALADAGPFGLFGGRSGGCSSGSCGGSAAMMGSSMTMRYSASTPAVGEFAANRSVDFYVNAVRARANLPAVTVDPNMNAEVKAALTPLADASTLKRLGLYKEVTARGWRNAQEFITAAMQVDEFRAAILSSDYGKCGFATVVGGDGKRYWTLAMAK